MDNWWQWPPTVAEQTQEFLDDYARYGARLQKQIEEFHAVFSRIPGVPQK